MPLFGRRGALPPGISYLVRGKLPTPQSSALVYLLRLSYAGDYVARNASCLNVVLVVFRGFERSFVYEFQKVVVEVVVVVTVTEEERNVNAQHW